LGVTPGGPLDDVAPQLAQDLLDVLAGQAGQLLAQRVQIDVDLASRRLGVFIHLRSPRRKPRRSGRGGGALSVALAVAG
jgi:hypothetical protein